MHCKKTSFTHSARRSPTTFSISSTKSITRTRRQSIRTSTKSACRVQHVISAARLFLFRRRRPRPISISSRSKTINQLRLSSRSFQFAEPISNIGLAFALRSLLSLALAADAQPLRRARLFRNLGRNGLRVSQLGLGTWVTFGGQISDDVAEELVTIAYDSGINLFDTAEVYAAGK